MKYNSTSGVTAQKLAATIANRIRDLSTAKIEGLTAVEESFEIFVRSRDGRLLQVSVVQKEGPAVVPIIQAEKVDKKYQRYLEVQDRKRKRWLGET